MWFVSGGPTSYTLDLLSRIGTFACEGVFNSVVLVVREDR